MRGWLPTGMREPIAIVAGIALLLTTTACGADKGSYVGQNDRILEALPQPPGAQRLTTGHNPYYDERGGPPIGWTTNVIYGALPEMTDQEVIDFYVQNMGLNWRAQVEEVPIVEVGTGERKGRVLNVLFTRGTAQVSVNTDNMYGGGPHTFEVAIDHEGVRQ